MLLLAVAVVVLSIGLMVYASKVDAQLKRMVIVRYCGSMGVNSPLVGD